MKALVILGSPRKGQNTDVLVEAIIRGLIDENVIVEKVILRNLNVGHCIDCKACANLGTCIIKDDMISLYDKFDKADIVVLASPLYFNSVTSLTKTMIDRCEALWASKYLLKESLIDRYKKRKGIFVCTAGSDSKNHEFMGAKLVADLFFKSINTEYAYEILVDNTDEKKVKSREDLIKNAYNKGIEIANG